MKKRILSLVLAVSLLLMVSIPANAVYLFRPKTTQNYVLNVNTWGMPQAGDWVTLWNSSGSDEQRWNTSGLNPYLHIVNEANTGLVIGAGYDKLGYMENANTVYAPYQDHYSSYIGSYTYYINIGLNSDYALGVDQLYNGARVTYKLFSYNNVDAILWSESIY